LGRRKLEFLGFIATACWAHVEYFNKSDKASYLAEIFAKACMAARTGADDNGYSAE